ncbi:M20/M25/M40 family metallo-hydrolase [Seongchinamella sediminis]|uniref:M20/M25/M40 family metallo-hydrolase n=1 Tax=Seongchinamella sediminis TaxID=2283635 RepID=A0A3L7DX69_9GAMM|nr:M28 family metallopeptidase [Seongchinamella sediminis]RLQ21746.1 M20/M25/M40 family metallo-hydrolase [Seongchinamella sediminis]
MKYFAPASLAVLLLLGGAAVATEAPAPRIDADRLSAIVKTLASDEFAGRAPGGPGEEKTVAYLIEQFRELGLEPGGVSGRWTQPVPLWQTQVNEPAFAVRTGDKSVQLAQGADVALSTLQPKAAVRVENAPVVFVGFGASAPERDWDDYGDIDLSGKVALFLVNDPDFSAAAGEPVGQRFGGKRMTYYGRWAYKFEEAERRGAIAAIVIHEDKAAGYGWGVASASPGENFSMVLSPGSERSLQLQGWMHWDAASRLFASAGLDLDEQRTLARHPDFSAFAMPNTRFDAAAGVAVQRIESQNVLARLPGTTRADETLMVASHWDAFGQGEPDSEGRTVRPGANDDALGTAGVIELARVLQAGPPLQRSVVFAAWTAEESGLLGSATYAANPVYPLASTVANFTLDILQTAGPAHDVILVGEGQSELEDYLERAAKRQGRYVTPENLPENGLFYRADHFSLAREGVPVLLIMGIAGGADLVDGGRAAGDAWIADYVGNCYHQTCDAWSPDWDLRGAVQDIELIHDIIRELGNNGAWPAWSPQSEFKAVRDRSRELE